MRPWQDDRVESLTNSFILCGREVLPRHMELGPGPDTNFFAIVPRLWFAFVAVSCFFRSSLSWLSFERGKEGQAPHVDQLVNWHQYAEIIFILVALK